MYRPQPCPRCSSSNTEVLESKACINGTRRRRLACQDCTHRWTTWDGPRPDRAAVVELKRPRRPQRRPSTPLTDDQIKEALLARDLSHAAMARRLGRSREAVRQIRLGITHADVHPEIARWGSVTPISQAKPATPVDGPTCHACANWQADRCSFGFPDPVEEGPAFAADCDLYAA